MRVYQNKTVILESNSLFKTLDEIVEFLKAKGLNPSTLDYEVTLKDVDILPTAKEFSKERSLTIFKSLTIYYGYSKKVTGSICPNTGQYIFKAEEFHSMW